MNQKNPPQVLRSEMRADSVPVDEHYSTEGYFYDNPILTRTGIFKYKLEDGSERRELRRPEDVFDPASLASYEGKPIIITHDAQAIDKDNARRERVGTILTPGQQDGETVRAKIVIDDPDAVKASGLRELSVGYYQNLIMEPGEWEGEPYDAIQTHIRVNHLALVAVARAGDDARLNMDGQDNGGTDPMDDENKKISLGFKKLEDNPWEILKRDYPVGTVVDAKIVGLAAFGAFANVIPGIDGLIHISQISWDRVKTPGDVLKVGDEVKCEITDIDFDKKRVSLSMKTLLPKPEEGIPALSDQD